MAHSREHKHLFPHRALPEAKKRHARKSRLTGYGLTPERFAQLLEAQRNACAMGGEPFEDGQLIHVDHDHACCKQKGRSCGKCVRGLLCHACNVALGHIERRGALARAHLANPPAQIFEQAA